MAVTITPATPPTLREIAQRAGVSHTTVSLSLRNDPTIPAHTRARLCTLADTMGYRSNVLVSALMTQVRLRQRPATPEVVGFLTGGPTEGDWTNHSASVGFYAGARLRAQQLGMRLEAFWLGPGGMRADETCRMLRARAIRGNLISPFPVPVYAKELDWSQLICVALGYAFRSQLLPRATHHHFRGSYTAVENLSRLGYRRIGLMLTPDENSRVGYGWLGGYLAAHQVSGGASLEPLFTPDLDDTRTIRRWLACEKPDVVIGFGPRQVSALEAAGCSIPGDIAFAALDVQQAKLNAVRDVAGIDQNLPVIGATAMDLLAVQLYHNEHGLPQGPVLSMVEGRWVDGETAPRREVSLRHQRAGGARGRR
jgi:LacI family transcriptional regulator